MTTLDWLIMTWGGFVMDTVHPMFVLPMFLLPLWIPMVFVILVAMRIEHR